MSSSCAFRSFAPPLDQRSRKHAWAPKLFRQEVLEARRTSGLGGVLLAQPLQWWLLTLAGTVAAGSIIVFLILGSYTRRSTVTGQRVPARGLATILAPATGVISRLDSDGGSRVKAGQVVAVVSVPSATVVNGATPAALEQRLVARARGLQAAQLIVQEQALRTQRVKPGMLLDTDILGVKWRLIEWVLESLYSLQGRIG